MNTTIEDVKQYFDQFGKVSDRCGKPVRLIGIQTEANFAAAGHGREGVTEERERRVGVGGGAGRENNEVPASSRRSSGGVGGRVGGEKFCGECVDVSKEGRGDYQNLN